MIIALVYSGYHFFDFNMQFRLTQKVQISFVLSALMLLCISLLAFISTRKLISNNEKINRNQQVQLMSTQLLLQMEEIDGLQQAYIISDSLLYIADINQKIARVQNLNSAFEIEMLNTGDSVLIDKYANIDSLISTRIKQAETAIAQKKSRVKVSAHPSHASMSQLRMNIDQIREHITHNIEVMSPRANRYAFITPLGIILLCLTGFAILFLAYNRIMKTILQWRTADKGRIKSLKEHKKLNAELQKMQEVLNNHNHELERKVHDRTKALNDSRKKYKFMAESIPHIVWTIDESGTFDYCSTKWKEITGVPVGKNCEGLNINLVYKEDRKRTLIVWERAFKAGEAFKIDHRLRFKTGEYRWMQSRGIPFKNERGEVIKWFGTTTLIDEEKHALDLLQRKEEQLRLLTDALPVLIAYVDTEEKYLFTNEAYEKWFGIKNKEISGRHIAEIIGKDAYDSIQPQIIDVLNGHRLEFEMQMNYQHAGSKYVKSSFIPQYFENSLIGFYSLVVDISPIKEQEDRLKLLLEETEIKNHELSRINSLLDDFVYMAAHDLKSPVSNLKLSIDLIQNADDDKQKMNVINYLGVSVDKLDKTLKGLLEVIEVQNIDESNVKNIWLQDIFDLVKQDFQDELERSHCTLEVDFSQAPSIYSLEAYVLCILKNLLSNAIKYRMSSRPLVINVKSKPAAKGMLLLSFSDNGIGMNLDQIGDKLFKPFKRFSQQAQGTGVGLHLIKTIAEKNGGYIDVLSTPGAGTSFRCYLRPMIKKEHSMVNLKPIK